MPRNPITGRSVGGARTVGALLGENRHARRAREKQEEAARLESLELTRPSREKCEACRAFAWTPEMYPVRWSRDHEWHHPACPLIASAANVLDAKDPR